MPKGLDNLKHIVVLMMSCRSFDHMLGGLKAKLPSVDGLTGDESNPDISGDLVRVLPNAEYRGLLPRDPAHHFPGVDLQIFGGNSEEKRIANMQGFVKSYAQQGASSADARLVMNYFSPEKIPVLTTLAAEFAVCNRWFSAIPGPTLCNRTFAHFGTSFGDVGMSHTKGLGGSLDTKVVGIFERMREHGFSAKYYRYDNVSALGGLSAEALPLGTFEEYLSDCAYGALPDYSFVEPNFSDHPGPEGGQLLATDQHPDHHVLAGDNFIGSVYDAIRINPELWSSTALLIVYDTHGGFYDHVPPPPCIPDGYVASAGQTGTGFPFSFDRLGVRVPAVICSPWIPRGTVMDDILEHASIPATITAHFLGNFDQRTEREKRSNTFLGSFSDAMRADSDCVFFPTADRSKRIAQKLPIVQTSTPTQSADTPTSPPARMVDTPEAVNGPSPYVARDRWTIDDALGHSAYAYAIYRFLTAKETRPPLAISIQAPWGGGKTSLMRMIQSNLDPDALARADRTSTRTQTFVGKATVKHVLDELEEVSNKSSRNRQEAALPESRDPSKPTPQTQIPPIQKKGERRVTVWFNAWKYESTAQVWAGLADCIVQQIGERLSPVARELFWFRLQLRRFDTAVIRNKVFHEVVATFIPRLLKWSWAYLAGICALAFSAAKHSWPTAIGVLAGELTIGAIQFWKAKSDTEAAPARISLGDLVRAPDYSANLGFVHEVAEDMKRVFAAIPHKDLPMVIFIDDLDRCSPGKVASVVEAINLFLAGEFPDCMFVLGIDDEMIAAALDKAHGDVIAKLPTYSKTSSIGWRFMDKFVQLPFVIPLPAQRDLAKYVTSLLSDDGLIATVTLEALDEAARVVEQHSASSMSPEQVVQTVLTNRDLTPERKQALETDVKIIQDMNENIKRFTDHEDSIRALISRHAKHYFNNPRDMKRFINLFRFYYFLRAARLAQGETAASLEQLCRWLVFSLKWPEVVRWLRRQSVSPNEDSLSSLAILEEMAESSKDFSVWQTSVGTSLNMNMEEALWLSDRSFYDFFRQEVSDFPPKQRLSSCLKEDTGIW